MRDKSLVEVLRRLLSLDMDKVPAGIAAEDVALARVDTIMNVVTDMIQTLETNLLLTSIFQQVKTIFKLDGILKNKKT